MAVISQVENWVIHAGGQKHAGWLPCGAATPPPLPKRDVVLNLQIEEIDGGFLLLWELVEDSPDFPETSLRCGDTWHQSVEQAKQQAEFEFGVPAGRWPSSP